MKKFKRAVATMMLACMLLTATNVSSNAGIMLCGEWLDYECELK